MKRLFAILFVLIGFLSNAQDSSPLPNTNIKKLIAPNSPVYYFNSITNDYWVFMGQYGWKKLGSSSDTTSIQYYSGIIPVSSSDFSITYPKSFTTDNYYLHVMTYYDKLHGAKSIRMENGVYDLNKLVSGFNLKLDTIAGFVEYLAIQGISDEILLIAVFNEIPSGLINSLNTIYTLIATPYVNSEQVYLNGIRQVKTSDFTLIGNSIVFSYAPIALDNLLIDYEKDDYGGLKNQILSGSINGTNTSFALPEIPITDTEKIFLNGIRLKPTVDYTITGKNINMLTAPITGDILKADYLTTANANYITNSPFSGAINGTNVTYTVSNPILNSQLYLNGIRQKLNSDYTVLGSTITMNYIPVTNDILIIDYKL